MNDATWLREAATFALDAIPRFVGIYPADEPPASDPDGTARFGIVVDDRIAVFEATQP